MPRERVVNAADSKGTTGPPTPRTKKRPSKKNTTKKTSKRTTGPPTPRTKKRLKPVHNIIEPLHKLMVPIGSLTRDPSNARSHNEKNLQAIMSSLKLYGQDQPLVVQKRGNIIRKGNGRHEAAMALGWTHIAAVVVDEEDLQAVARAIADNRTAELAEWDGDVLRQLLEVVNEGTDDLFAATGFDAIELATIADAADNSARNVHDPGVRTSPAIVSRSGDVWQCGAHTVMCGDCRNEAHVAELLDADHITLAITSPPYAAQREYDEGSGFAPVAPEQYVEWFEPVQRLICERLAPNGSWCVNIKEHCEGGQRSLYVKDLTIAHVRAWGWRFIEEYCWKHEGTPRAPRLRFKNAFEPVFHFARSADFVWQPDRVKHGTDWSPGGGKANVRAAGVGATGVGMVERQGEPGAPGSMRLDTAIATSMDGHAYPSNVLSVGKNRDALGHSAAFPVALPEFFVRVLSNDNDIVYEPFGGSGTTLIACEQLQRRCRLMEISAEYCDIVLRRWMDLTGNTPIRREDGAEFRALDTAPAE